MSVVHSARSIPKAPPATEMRTLSDRRPLASWPRLAPSATRTDVSSERADARASMNDATLAHAMKKTAPPASRSSPLMRAIPLDASAVMPV